MDHYVIVTLERFSQQTVLYTMQFKLSAALIMLIKSQSISPAINHEFLSIIFSADLRVHGSARALQTIFGPPK